MATILKRRYCGTDYEDEQIVVEPSDAEYFATLASFPEPEPSHLSYERRIAGLSTKARGDYAGTCFEYRISVVHEPEKMGKKYIVGLHRIMFDSQ